MFDEVHMPELLKAAFSPIAAIAAKSANFEAVIETEAVDGHAGPPHVVAIKTW